MLKTLIAFFSLPFDFQAYSLKFGIFAHISAPLIFFLINFRQNKKFLFCSVCAAKWEPWDSMGLFHQKNSEF